MNLKLKFMGYLTLLNLCYVPFANADEVQAKCLQDLQHLPVFLLKNDTGAPEHLKQYGQTAIDQAMNDAKLKIETVEDKLQCLKILNDYLKSWRKGHLAIVDLDEQKQKKAAKAKLSKSEDKREPSIEFLSDKTLLLTLPSFNGAYQQSVEDIISDHKKQLISHKNWIIDVRNNNGGSDWTYSPLMPWLMPDEYINISAEWLVTPQNIQGQKEVCEIFSPGDEDCKQFMDKAVARMEQAKQGEYVLQQEEGAFSYVTEDYVKELAPNKVAVLIDKPCGSSCEEFLLTVKQSFKVKLLGRRTYGVLDYSNLRPYNLPSSQRQLFYATSRSKRLPHLPVDLAGVIPDIYLPKPENDEAYRQEVLQVKSWLEGGSLKPMN